MNAVNLDKDRGLAPHEGGGEEEEEERRRPCERLEGRKSRELERKTAHIDREGKEGRGERDKRSILLNTQKSEHLKEHSEDLGRRDLALYA